MGQTGKQYKLELVWSRIIALTVYHILALQAIYYMVTLNVKWATFPFGYGIVVLSGQGITAGVHRLWCHRTYKAKLPLRILLCFWQTMSFQIPLFEWCRDHRVHHKFSDTDADPHNASRGFFFSHMGWLMVRKHPDVIKYGKTIDLSDLLADPVVRFQRKYFLILAPLLCFVLPTIVPWYFWGEDLYKSFLVAGVLKYVWMLHANWSVNSFAHTWGMRPYDRHIKPSENSYVSMVTYGEGWHNYHHTFPWDYKAAELGSYSGNWTTGFIDLMAKIGWAYDLKTASPQLVRQRIEKTRMEEEEKVSE